MGLKTRSFTAATVLLCCVALPPVFGEYNAVIYPLPPDRFVEIGAGVQTPTSVQLVGIVSWAAGSFVRSPMIIPSQGALPVEIGGGGYVSAAAVTPLGVLQAGQQEVVVGGGGQTTHAKVWRGIGSAPVDLHVTSNMQSDRSIAYGIAATPNGFQSAGFSVTSGGTDHAHVWIASSFDPIQQASLHHSSMYESRANGAFTVNGIPKQVGYARLSITAQHHAIVWSGTAASFADVTPAGYVHATLNFGNGDNGNEVLGGVAGRTTSEGRPTIWRGPTLSPVFLSTGALSQGAVLWNSQTHATGVIASGPQHAAVWDLQTLAVTDLHSRLPVEYASGISQALFRDSFGNVFGQARTNAGSPGWVPVVWMVPEPGTLPILAFLLSASGMRRRGL